ARIASCLVSLMARAGSSTGVTIVGRRSLFAVRPSRRLASRRRPNSDQRTTNSDQHDTEEHGRPRCNPRHTAIFGTNSANSGHKRHVPRSTGTEVTFAEFPLG